MATVKIDYLKIPTTVDQMREHAKTMNDQLVNAYQRIGEMKSAWQGERYDSLVTKMNETTGAIHEFLRKAVKEIPDALNDAASNYAQVDRGSRLAASEGAVPKEISQINPSNAELLDFNSEQIDSAANEIKGNFEKALTSMGEIATAFSGITWESAAASEFKNRFNEIKATVEESITYIKNSFQELVETAKADVQAAENASTV